MVVFLDPWLGLSEKAIGTLNRSSPDCAPGRGCSGGMGRRSFVTGVVVLQQIEPGERQRREIMTPE